MCRAQRMPAAEHKGEASKLRPPPSCPQPHPGVACTSCCRSTPASCQSMLLRTDNSWARTLQPASWPCTSRSSPGSSGVPVCRAQCPSRAELCRACPQSSLLLQLACKMSAHVHAQVKGSHRLQACAPSSLLHSPILLDRGRALAKACSKGCWQVPRVLCFPLPSTAQDAPCASFKCTQSARRVACICRAAWDACLHV